MFLLVGLLEKMNKNYKIDLISLIMTNGLAQHITVEESTSFQWANTGCHLPYVGSYYVSSSTTVNVARRRVPVAC